MTSMISREALLRAEGQIVPASFTQQQAWILDQLIPEENINTLSVTIHAKQALSVQILTKGLNALLQRHESLRTIFRFQAEERQLLQVIAPRLTIPLSVFDLRALQAEEREAEAQRLASEKARHPFDMSQGPLVRACLLQLDTEESLLLLSVHRSICDIWSLKLLLHELATLYEALASDQSSPLPEPPRPYTEFAQWQLAWLQEEEAATELGYWKQQLANCPDALKLPTSHQQSPVPTYQSATRSVTLSRTLSENLRDLSRREDASLEIILLAALLCLLYRYTGQEDLVIGTITAGYRPEGNETTVGLFENILALRSSLTDNLPFHQVLRQMSEKIQEIQVYQKLPFEYLIKELYPTHTLDQNPLFQAMLTVSPSVSLPLGWTLRQMENGTPRSNLSLEVEEWAKDLRINFKYRRDQLDEETIDRLVGHWQTLLESIVADLTQSIAHLPLLTAQERHQLLVEWNPPPVEDFQDGCVHELFEDQAERTPEAVAMVCKGEQLTYGELNQQANQLACHLRGMGIHEEVSVGLCIEPSVKVIVGMLAILKAGGVYVPMDSTYPSERIAFMAQETKMPLLITEQHLLTRFSQSHLQLVCLDADWPTISQHPTTNLPHTVKGDHLAYIIFTSGSTGRPKGVLIEHQSIASHCEVMIKAQELNAADCCLQLNTFTFDASLEQILPPLLVGARLILRGPTIWSPDEFLQQAKDHQLTVATGSCGYWHEVISHLATIPPEQVSGLQLRLIGAGGDRLSPEAVRLWRKLPLPSLQFFNHYGPTESTITATLFEIPRHLESEQLETSIPIGRPLPNCRVYLLDKFGQPVPQGVAGELHIGGNILARGYLNHPELTAERFIADPFSQQPQARLYKTGDLARYLPGGLIAFIGRVDHQVKIRGFRIEPGEIEAVIVLHPAVYQAVVLVREDTPGLKRLVAYVVPHPDQQTSEVVTQLRSLLKERLPDYMIPAAIVLLETFPLNSSGKIDRHALPAPDTSRNVVNDSYVAPRLPVEQQLVEIWEELLGTRPIGIKDDFFELGGDSLLAMRLFGRMAQMFSKKLPLSTFFGGATIEHLAKALAGESMGTLPAEIKTDERARLVAVQTGGSKRPFFFLHGQWTNSALYSLELARVLGPDQPFYLLEPYKFEDLAPLPTIGEVVAAYIKVLRSVQPEGPYLLGGWCNGAVWAYEIARQLQAQGLTTELLVLMDPDVPGHRGRERRVITSLGNLLGLSSDKQADWFIAYRHIRKFFYYWRLSKFKPKRAATQSMPNTVAPKLNEFIPSREVMRDWPNIYEWMLAGYRPQFYPGKIAFFWTEEEPHRKEIWRRAMETQTQADNVEVHIIPGNHITSRTEYLPIFAERFRECLTKI